MHNCKSIKALLEAYTRMYVEEEYRFAPNRRWRFDFAIPAAKVAVEIEGGAYINGRHTRGVGYIKDMEKYNKAAELGWTVLRYTPQQIMKTEALQQILDVVVAKMFINIDQCNN